MLWMRMGIKELLLNKGFSFFFILNLSLGLAGFIAIHSFGRSLDRHLDTNLKEILTADLVVSSNKPISPKDMEILEQTLKSDKQQAQLISFYSMIRAKDKSRLARIMAIDDSYPLYGSFELERNSNKSQSHIQTRPNVFMSADTAYSLGLEIDSPDKNHLKIGDQTFSIIDHYISDPEKSLTALEFAPKIFMGIDQLKDTGLIQFGSRVWASYFYRFPPETDVASLTEQLKLSFNRAYNNEPPVYIYNSKNTNQRLGRITRYFTGYMRLISVVTLFLAGIATAYLFRGYLNLKQKEIAVLMSIGAARKSIWFYISFQLIILGSCASLLAILFSYFLIPAFPVIFKGLIPANVSLSTEPITFFIALGLGIVGSIIFCLPVFVRIFDIKPLFLLQGNTSETFKKSDSKLYWLKLIVSLLPGTISFVLISIYAAGSTKTGLIFVAGFTLAFGILSIIGRGFIQLCKSLSTVKTPSIKIAFRNLFRNKWASLTCFVTIAMGAFLISLIPQVQHGLQREIVKPDGLKIPVFFLVDIQDEQKDPFIKFIKEENAEITTISPMVRGRIIKKNGEQFEGQKSKSNRWGRRLEYNFSFRQKLDVSETISKGPPLTNELWDWQSGKSFEISVAESFAKGHDITIGDILDFEIQGIPFTGRIKNFRKVRWNSFQPNFFLLFQNGVLNDAPKTYLAAISQVPNEKRQTLKNKIVDKFPNISVIDVTKMAETLLDISDKLSLSIRFMAWLAIAAGLISIFSISRHQAWKNQNQINLLKILGSEYRSIQAITLLEFGSIGFSAALFAIILSYGFSWAISWYFFDSLWLIDFNISLTILVLTTLVCMITALVATKKVMDAKPISLLTN